MDYPHGHACVKTLTPSDVNDRLALPTEMADIMPVGEPGHKIPIRVLDDSRRAHQFYLSVRSNGYRKPVFQAKEWRAFIEYSGAEVGDKIYFWHHVDELMQTQYRIFLFKNYLPPHPDL